VLRRTPLAVWAYTTHLAVTFPCASMRNYAQQRLDMRKHADARDIAQMCTLGRLGGGGRIAARRLLLNNSAGAADALVGSALGSRRALWHG
jgi:hypothetical protein